MYVTGTRVTSLTYLHLGRMLVVKDRPTAWRNSRKVTTRTPFGVQNMHFFHFAFLLGGNHSNVLASGIKGCPDLGLLFFRRQVIVGFEVCHEIINFDTKGLLASLDFAIQKDNVRLFERTINRDESNGE
jgi:hypothetical protein